MGFLEQQRELARKAGQTEDWQGALNIWEMLRTCFLDSSEVLVGRGDALQALGQLDEAEAAFAEAKELDDAGRTLNAITLLENNRVKAARWGKSDGIPGSKY